MLFARLYNNVGDCMNIVICDDKPEVCYDIEKYIKNNFTCNVFTCTNADDLLQSIEKNKCNIQAVILDIVLSESVNGITVGTEIHKRYPAIKIIFLTGYDDIYYKQIFSDFQPFGFITKPVQYNILNFFLHKIQLEEQNQSKHLEFTADYKECKLPLNEIMYIQSRKRVCEIYAKNRVHRVYLKISALEKELTDSFVRCHQSYIVNPDFVVSADKTQLVLKNGDRVPVSRKYSAITLLFENQPN